MSVLFMLSAGTNFNGTAGAWAGTNTPSTSGCTNTFMGTNVNTFQISGVQLEVNTQVTPFEYLFLQTEYSRNQRYFWNVPGPTVYWVGGYTSGAGANLWLNVNNPVSMRVAPTGNIVSSGANNIASSSLNSTAITHVQYQITSAATGAMGLNIGVGSLFTSEFA